MIYLEKPEWFKAKFEIVSIFLEFDWKILLLHRQDHKSEWNTWWVPAWKKEENEDIYDAIIRETQEETWIDVNKKDIKFFKEVYVRYENYDFIYHIFNTKLEYKTQVIINPNEHKNYIWINPFSSIKELDLIEALDECIKLYYK